MKAFLRKTRGITLIALVITIIVLLILAGVALSLVLGENGITNRAVKAGKTQNMAGAKEKVELDAANYGAEFYQAKYVNNDPSATSIQSYIMAKFSARYPSGSGTYEENFTLAVDTDHNQLTLTSNIASDTTTSATATIESDGKVVWQATAYGDNSSGGNGGNEEPATSNLSSTELAALSANGMSELTSDDIDNDSNLTPEQKAALKDPAKIKAVLSGNVPVPVGYDYMQGTSTADGLTKPDGGSWGVVITDSNDNEWVWVPVNANESVAPDEIYETVDSVNVGSKENKNKNLKFAENKEGFRIASLNGLNGLRLADSSSSSEEGSQYLTDVTTNKKGTTILSGYDRTDPRDTSDYREPAILGDYDGDYYSQAGFSSVNDMATAFVTDYNNMTASIAKYGGFYVGRYELSGTNNGGDSQITNPKVQSGQAPMDNVNWYRLYQACGSLGSSTTISTMIWGTQWDLVCKWTNDKGDQVSYSQYHSSAHSGNYIATTGSNANDLRNNIYDLEGSRYEWTQEAYSAVYRALRGGNYIDDYYDYASYRRNYYPYVYDYYGSRPTLYINVSEN